ncbi:MAG: DNA double-strand break repair nuclease NurA [Candidatus Helarchaeota archaeon]
MSEIIEDIQSIAQKIHKIETEKDKFADIFSDLKSEIDFNLIKSLIKNDTIEDKLIFKVIPTSLSGLTIAGIDGGIIAKNFYNFDLIATRAVACIFEFNKNKPNVIYYPEQSPTPKIISNITPQNQTESEIFISLERIKEEIDLAISLSNRAKRPNLIILDGSILPLPSDKPGSSSELILKYEQVLEKYRILFKNCIDKNILLAGCVKDSRSRRFTSFMGKAIPHLMDYFPRLNLILDLDYRGIINRLYDCELLYRILEVNERTCILNYVENPKNHFILKDFDDDIIKRLKIFYLKAVPYDFPMRVEYLTLNSSPISTANKISAAILPLSCHHVEFAVPTILIEADARAKLRDSDIDVLCDILVQKIGIKQNYFELRRNRRPFR